MHRKNAVKKPPKRTRPPTRLLRRFSSLEENYETEKRKSLALYQLQDFESRSGAVPKIFEDQKEIRNKLRASVEQYNCSDLCVKLASDLLPQLNSWDGPEMESFAVRMKRVFKINDEKYAELINIARNTFVPRTVVHIYVVEAQNIPPKDSNGLSDPFCVIFVGDKRGLAQKTKVVQATLNPVWKEHFTLDLNDPIKDVLHVDVMDHNDHDELFQNRVRKVKDVKSPGGLGVLLKDLVKARLDEEPIGSLKISVLEVFPKPIENWFDLEQNEINCGKIYLRIALGTGKPIETILQEYIQILHLLVLSELDKDDSEKIPIYWDENFDNWSKSVLRQLKLQGGLLPKHVILIKWRVYTTVNSIIPMNSKMMYFLMDAIMGKVLHSEYNDLESSQVWTYTIVFVDSIIMFFTEICNISLNSVAMDQAHHMLKSLELLNQVLDNIPKCDRVKIPFKKSTILNRVKEALKTSAYNNYIKIFTKATDDQTGNVDYPMYQTMEILLKTGQLLHEDLADGLSTIQNGFENILDVDYFATTYQVYDLQFGKMVKCIMEQYNNNLTYSDSKFLTEINEDLNEDSPAVKSASSIFMLYFAVKNLASLVPENYDATSEFSLKNYHDWFYQSVDVWITTLRRKIMKFVKKSVEFSQPNDQDHITKIYDITHRDNAKDTPYGTSAIDTVHWFHEINKFWISLGWQNPKQSYFIVRKLLEELYGYMVYYATELFEVIIRNQPPLELQKDDVTISAYLKKTCTEVENISYVKNQVGVLAQQLNISDIIKRISSCAVSSLNFNIYEVNKGIDSCLDASHKQVEVATADIMSHCLKIATPKLQALLEAVLKDRKQNLNTCPQFKILIDYIDNCLTIMNNNLEARNFQLILIKFWREAVNQVNGFIDFGLQVVKTSEYFQTLSDLITVLNSLFWPSDMEVENTDKNRVNAKLFDEYQLLKERLSYFHLPLAELKLKYYGNRYKRQQIISTKSNNHGNVTVRTWFLNNEAELVVELMNARNLKSYDTNSLSDPFAVVTLVPSERFPSMPKYSTKVHNKTLFPLFEETFTFKINADELQSGYLLITLFDSNYFVDEQMGEVFLPLASIKKVQKDVVSKFRLPQIFLEVSKPDESDIKYLELLEHRSWDKKTLQFCNQERTKRSN